MATNDWCHFAARVERTAEHRRLKQAELSYEDEKFSYLAVARENFFGADSDKNASHARIVRHPQLHGGYAQLTLCTNGKIEQATVTRSHKNDWRRLKRLGWGDGW
jgi:ribosomal protein RSM22 (predicted rRNA methylase)